MGRFTLLATALSLAAIHALGDELLKTESVLYPSEVVERVRANVERDPWAASVRDAVVENAAPWRAMSDDELWELMFCATLPRSWMVWSDGYSPATGDPVPMYNWIMDALEHPWKVKCPHSGDLFPTNDFKAYYESGLNEARVFDPDLADDSLLYNTGHPDPDDPLHLFGVDDGHGYVNEKGERWRFINAYLIYGQWKQAVLGGIRNLSAAYLLTGDAEYARKAGILLDRVADFYPTFDFGPQGVMYEGPAAAGYVSTWHDACEETREMALAYDMIFEALRADDELVAFLSDKAQVHGLDNPKESFADVQRNIEGRIFRDALENIHKVRSNYPRTDVLKAILLKVLGEPEEAFWEVVEPMLERATAVDGVTGEKGLSGYASFTIAGMALFLAECAKADPGFLEEAIERCPRLEETYRFHIDTFCLDRYYPQSGDSGHFAGPVDSYVGMGFPKPGKGGRYGDQGLIWSPLPPSSYRLLWDLYEATDDPAYVQVLYRENGRELAGLPYDIYGEDAETFQDNVANALEQHGTDIAVGSVNKTEWHIAILRSGAGEHARALWLDYDTGGAHGHRDGLNLGLFGYGIDLLPEMGYPPVQYGGWDAPRARWYMMAAAHNTVVVDRQDHTVGDGVTQLWADGRVTRAIRAGGPAMNAGRRFERTAVLVDICDKEYYVVDVFRIAGGTDHTKFVHSHFGAVDMPSLELEPQEDMDYGGQMRNFRMAPATEAGWTATWSFEDRLDVLAHEREIGMRYTDLTHDAEPGLAEGWISVGSFDASEETWIPRVLARRRGEEDQAPLESAFAAVYEPFIDAPPERFIRRLGIQDETGAPLDDSHVALEIVMADGARDILILPDPEDARTVRCEEAEAATTDAEFAFLRLDEAGAVIHAALANGSRLTVGSFELGEGIHHEFIETSSGS